MWDSLYVNMLTSFLSLKFAVSTTNEAMGPYFST